MSYPNRVDWPGALHHVTARGNNHRRIFGSPHERLHLLAILRQVAGDHRWTVLAYCVMSNHIHLVVSTDDGTLSDGMRALCGAYARMHNARCRRSNHVFGRRFWNRPIEDETDLLTVLRYVYLNPVTARVVTHPSLWDGSSYRQTVADASRSWLAADEVLRLFHHRDAHARVLLERFVLASPAPVVDVTEPPRPRPPVTALVGLLGPVHGVERAMEAGHPIPEIARVLGVAETTVRRRLLPKS